MREPVPTIPDERSSILPVHRKQLRMFWDELGPGSVYTIGTPRREGKEAVTPIDIVCTESLMTEREYDPSLDFIIGFVTWKEFSEGNIISSVPRPASGAPPPLSIPRPSRDPHVMPSMPPPPPSRRAETSDGSLRVPRPTGSAPPPPPSRRVEPDDRILMVFPYRGLEVLPESNGRLRRLWVGRDVPSVIAPRVNEQLCLLISFPTSMELLSRLAWPRK